MRRMSFQRDSYPTAEAFLLAVKEDEGWACTQQRLTQGFAANAVVAEHDFRQEATELIGEGFERNEWRIMGRNVLATLRNVWDETELTLARLRQKVIGMLMWEWMDEQLNANPRQEVVATVEDGSDKAVDHKLCIELSLKQRIQLQQAERAGIIIYKCSRVGYDVAPQSSKRLVAYLCGRMFCGDRVENGVWKAGLRFDDASFCTQLFGFDVGASRRTAQGNGAGKPPKGYERVDLLFD